MLRTVVQRVLGVSGLLGIIILFFKEYFLELARDFGAFADPSGRVGRIMTYLVEVVNSYPFHALLWVSIGAALGVYADWLTSKKAAAHLLSKIVRSSKNSSGVHDAIPLEIIEDATFDHKTVGIDGKHFINCHFKGGSTLVYNGGRFRMNECSKDSSRLVLASTSREVAATVSLLDTLGMLPDGGQSSQIDLALLDSAKA